MKTKWNTIELLNGANIAPEKLLWLWPGWLAAGKLHVLAGQPGTGKTALAMAMAAILSRGGQWPSGDPARQGVTLIWSGEDGYADTLVPRLKAMGADLSRILFLGDILHNDKDKPGVRPFNPATDMFHLQDSIKHTESKPDLLILDPVVSAVAGDSHKNAEVRRSLQPLVDLANRHKMAVLGITHFAKGTAGLDPIDRVAGSLAFGALARVVMATGRRNGGGVLVRTKNNLGSDYGGVEYELDSTRLEDLGGIESLKASFGAPLDGTARQLLSKCQDEQDMNEGKNAQVMEWLCSFLAHGPVDAGIVFDLGEKEGYSAYRIRQAAKKLKVNIKKGGWNKGWTWELSRSFDDAINEGLHGPF